MTVIKLSHLKQNFFKPIDIAGLAIFRVALGLLLFLGIIRFMEKSWVTEFYVKPKYFFSYYGFSWIQPWPEWGMQVHFIILALAALGIVFGLFYRWSAAIFFLAFTYVELLDKANYLNHYYLISLISFLLIFLPLHKSFSIDAWLRPKLRSGTTAQGVLWTLRLQVGIVYFFAGFAKIKSDWLFQAQPLKAWLQGHPELPLLGQFVHQAWLAYAMSWGGMLFDLCVPFLLLWRRTRLAAFCLLIFFHLLTLKLFYIGMFPWIMIVLALVFFPPEWPRNLPLTWQKSLGLYPFTQKNEVFSKTGFRRYVLAFWIFWFGIQFFTPLRHFLYPGNVCWTEEGFRFSWNVMLMEKNGFVEFEVRQPSSGKKWVLPPKEYLSPFQAKMMSTQPDMILQFAHYLKKKFEEEGYEGVEVHAHAFASLNGREVQRLIDPSIDLAKISEGFAPKTWIVPLEKIPAK